MDFKEWRENHARRNKNMFIIDTIVDKTGKEKYQVYNEHNGKVTVNQVYGKEGKEYFGIKGEEGLFYLNDFLYPGEKPKEVIVNSEDISENCGIPEDKKKVELIEEFEISFIITPNVVKIIQAMKEGKFVKNEDIKIKSELSIDTVRKTIGKMEKDGIVEREPGKVKLLVSKDKLFIKGGGIK